MNEEDLKEATEWMGEGIGNLSQGGEEELKVEAAKRGLNISEFAERLMRKGLRTAQ